MRVYKSYVELNIFIGLIVLSDMNLGNLCFPPLKVGIESIGIAIVKY